MPALAQKKPDWPHLASTMAFSTALKRFNLSIKCIRGHAGRCRDFWYLIWTQLLTKASGSPRRCLIWSLARSRLCGRNDNRETQLRRNRKGLSRQVWRGEVWETWSARTKIFNGYRNWCLELEKTVKRSRLRFPSDEDESKGENVLD